VNLHGELLRVRGNEPRMLLTSLETHRAHLTVRYSCSERRKLSKKHVTVRILILLGSSLANYFLFLCFLFLITWKLHLADKKVNHIPVDGDLGGLLGTIAGTIFFFRRH